MVTDTSGDGEMSFTTSTHVPIVESQGGVRRAEFVVKLLGDAHGAVKKEMGWVWLSR